jgi:hypothetical protein
MRCWQHTAVADVLRFTGLPLHHCQLLPQPGLTQVSAGLSVELRRGRGRCSGLSVGCGFRRRVRTDCAGGVGGFGRALRVGPDGCTG